MDTETDLIDFLEELTIELFYLAGEGSPASDTILGLAVALDTATALLAKRNPSVSNVGEFAT